MVVLSTHTERTQVALRYDATLTPKRPRRNGEKRTVHLKGV